MNNYELHAEATFLVDTTSHYELARDYLMMAECYGELLKPQTYTPCVYRTKNNTTGFYTYHVNEPHGLVYETLYIKDGE